jgi:hypothetical protein
MKCYYCGHNIKEGFLTVDNVVKAGGSLIELKCPKCKTWNPVKTAMSSSMVDLVSKDRDAS